MIYAAVILALLGATLLALAIRGARIDDHPICRRCRFDLVGLDTASSKSLRCPECGADVSSRRALRHGHRRIHTKLAILAVIVLVAGALPASILAWGTATGTNWNSYKPQWWLAADVRRGGSSADPALAELEERLRDERLSRETSLAMVELLLKHQQDQQLAWSDHRASFLESARQLGMLTDAQVLQYAKAAMPISVTMRPRVAQASPWPIRLHTSETRISRASDLRFAIATLGLWIDDERVDRREHHRASIRGGHSGITSFVYGGLSTMTVGPGTYELRIPVQVTVIDAGQDNRELCRWQEEFTATIQVVRPGEPLIELVSDESMRASMQASVESRSAILTDQGARGAGMVALRAPPLDVFFDIYWRFDDPFDPEGYREVRMGDIAARAGDSAATRYQRSLNAPIPPERIELILRPSLRAQASATAYDRIWGEEIIIPLDLDIEEETG